MFRLAKKKLSKKGDPWLNKDISGDVNGDDRGTLYVTLSSPPRNINRGSPPLSSRKKMSSKLKRSKALWKDSSSRNKQNETLPPAVIRAPSIKAEKKATEENEGPNTLSASAAYVSTNDSVSDLVTVEDDDQLSFVSDAVSSVTQSVFTAFTERNALIQRVCSAPPGRLEIAIDDASTGPIVNEVKGTSPMEGIIFPGDRIVAIDGNDIRGFSCEDCKRVMAESMDRNRTITVLSVVKKALPPPEKANPIFRRTFVAPPGKIGVIIGKSEIGPIVNSVKQGSPLEGRLYKGDRIIEIDDIDTRGLRTAEVTKVMGDRVDKQRTITVLSDVEEDELRISPSLPDGECKEVNHGHYYASKSSTNAMNEGSKDKDFPWDVDADSNSGAQTTLMESKSQGIGFGRKSSLPSVIVEEDEEGLLWGGDDDDCFKDNIEGKEKDDDEGDGDDENNDDDGPINNLGGIPRCNGYYRGTSYGTSILSEDSTEIHSNLSKLHPSVSTQQGEENEEENESQQIRLCGKIECYISQALLEQDVAAEDCFVSNCSDSKSEEVGSWSGERRAETNDEPDDIKSVTSLTVSSDEQCWGSSSRNKAPSQKIELLEQDVAAEDCVVSDCSDSKSEEEGSWSGERRTETNDEPGDITSITSLSVSSAERRFPSISYSKSESQKSSIYLEVKSQERYEDDAAEWKQDGYGFMGNLSAILPNGSALATSQSANALETTEMVKASSNDTLEQPEMSEEVTTLSTATSTSATEEASNSSTEAKEETLPQPGTVRIEMPEKIEVPTLPTITCISSTKDKGLGKPHDNVMEQTPSSVSGASNSSALFESEGRREGESLRDYWKRKHQTKLSDSSSLKRSPNTEKPSHFRKDGESLRDFWARRRPDGLPDSIKSQIDEDSKEHQDAFARCEKGSSEASEGSLSKCAGGKSSSSTSIAESNIIDNEGDSRVANTEIERLYSSGIISRSEYIEMRKSDELFTQTVEGQSGEDANGNEKDLAGKSEGSADVTYAKEEGSISVGERPAANPEIGRLYLAGVISKVEYTRMVQSDERFRQQIKNAEDSNSVDNEPHEERDIAMDDAECQSNCDENLSLGGINSPQIVSTGAAVKDSFVECTSLCGSEEEDSFVECTSLCGSEEEDRTSEAGTASHLCEETGSNASQGMQAKQVDENTDTTNVSTGTPSTFIGEDSSGSSNATRSTEVRNEEMVNKSLEDADTLEKVYISNNESDSVALSSLSSGTIDLSANAVDLPLLSLGAIGASEHFTDDPPMRCARESLLIHFAIQVREFHGSELTPDESVDKEKRVYIIMHGPAPSKLGQMGDYPYKKYRRFRRTLKGTLLREQWAVSVPLLPRDDQRQSAYIYTNPIGEIKTNRDVRNVHERISVQLEMGQYVEAIDVLTNSFLPSLYEKQKQQTRDGEAYSWYSALISCTFQNIAVIEVMAPTSGRMDSPFRHNLDDGSTSGIASLMVQGIASFGREEQNIAIQLFRKIHSFIVNGNASQDDEKHFKNYISLGKLLNNVACSLYVEGDYEGARKAFQRALHLLVYGGEDIAQGSAGNVSELAQAIEDTKSDLDAADTGNNKVIIWRAISIAIPLCNIAKTLIKLEEHSEANEALKPAPELFKAIPGSSNRLKTSIARTKGDLSMSMDQYIDALKSYESLLLMLEERVGQSSGQKGAIEIEEEVIALLGMMRQAYREKAHDPMAAVRCLRMRMAHQRKLLRMRMMQLSDGDDIKTLSAVFQNAL